MKKQPATKKQNQFFVRCCQITALAMLLLLTQYGTTKAQTWTTPFKQGGTTYLSVSLNATFMFSATQGWAVGNDGTIIVTTDGGATWTQQTSGTVSSLRSVFFISATQGWAVGDKATIITTNNGGTTWSAQSTSINSGYGLTGVCFTSTTQGWAVGVQGTIITTSNGGSTWAAQTSGTTSSFSAVKFASATAGWATTSDGKILGTSNGGTSWSQQTSGHSYLGSITFVSATQGWACGISGKIITTSNGGSTWTSQSISTIQSFYGIHFISATNGYVVGSSGTIYITTNGGTSWSQQTSGITNIYENLTAVCMGSATQAIAVGNAGIVLATSNSGTTWTRRTTGTRSTFASASFASASQGWAVGSEGSILMTTDAGSTWTPQSSGVTSSLNSVWFVSATQGWAVGDNGVIRTTSNGGTTWTAQSGAGTDYLYGVNFFSATQGWIVGSDGSGAGYVIYATTNGGTTWTRQKFIANVNGSYFTAVYFASATKGWAVGAEGAIYITSDAGANWTAQSSGLATPASEYFTSVYFADANNGWIVGDVSAGSGRILATTNGGSTWTPQTSGTVNGLYSIRFTSATKGWAAGQGGTILTTSNGGSTWTPQTSGTNGYIFNLSFNSSTKGWGVGSEGLVLLYSALPTNTTWNGSTWSDGAPTASVDAIIASSTTPGSFTCKSLTINNGYALTIGSGVTATVNGDITNNGNGISGAGNLTIATSAGLLGTAISFNGILTVNAGATLTTNNLLTLKSTSIANTAMVANSAGTISGNVTVERFIPARRAFRLMAPGVTTTTTIKANWQEGQNNTTTASNSNTNAGYGTHITGSTNGSNGFDATTTGNPSLFTFGNNAANTWTQAANTGTATLNALTAYRLMVRGSRAVNLNNNAATADATVLRATGILNNASSVVFNNASTPTALNTTTTTNQNFSMVPNPYWAPINWATITKSGIGTSYYIWDPTQNTRGAYTSWNGTVGNGGSINQYIQPGQAFFVTSTTATPSLTIQQSDKATSASNLTTTFRTQNSFAKLSIELTFMDASNNRIYADAATAIFGNYSKEISNEEEAYKLTNLDEMLSINRNNMLLSIEARPMPITANDTLPLALSQFTQSQYSLHITANNFSYTGKNGYVVDKYLNKNYPLNMEGLTTVDFELNNDVASKAADRFMIVLGKATQPMQATMAFSLKLSPNPVKHLLSIDYEGLDEKENSSLQIIAADGSIVTTSNIGKVQAGKQAINIQSLSNGMYTLQLLNGSSKQVLSFIKQ